MIGNGNNDQTLMCDSLSFYGKLLRLSSFLSASEKERFPFLYSFHRLLQIFEH